MKDYPLPRGEKPTLKELALEITCRVCNALDHLRRIRPDLAKGFKVVWDSRGV